MAGPLRFRFGGKLILTYPENHNNLRSISPERAPTALLFSVFY